MFNGLSLTRGAAKSQQHSLEIHTRYRQQCLPIEKIVGAFLETSFQVRLRFATHRRGIYPRYFLTDQSSLLRMAGVSGEVRKMTRTSAQTK